MKSNDTPPPTDDQKANNAAGEGCMARLVRLFRIEDWPDACDGIEIAERIRIGWFARHLRNMPTLYHFGPTRKPGYQIRIGRFGVAFKYQTNA